jgi:spore maturation protein CgeB
MNNKICIVGVLDKKGSTQIPMAKSLINLSLDIIPINYRSLISKYGHEFYYEYLINTIKEQNPYLTIFCKHNNTDPRIMSECNKYTKTFLFFMDPLETLLNCSEVIEQMNLANFSSYTDPDIKKYVNNCHHLIQGVDTDIFKPIDIFEEDKVDISFIGTKTKERDEYIDFLRLNKFDVKTYGSGYSDNEVVEEDFAKICSSSTYMLSLNTFNNKKDYFSNRLVRYLACGTCTFHLDTTNTLDKYFKDCEEIVYFSSKEDLVEKLNSITEEERIQIGINGRNRVLKEYTWDIKMKELLDIVSNYNENTLQ